MSTISEVSKPQRDTSGKYTQKLLVDGHEVKLIYAALDNATTSMKALTYTLNEAWENSRSDQKQERLPIAG